MASQTFNRIIREVQSSHLKFQLQLSPFFEVMSIKKSFVKEKDGSVCLPPVQCNKASESECKDLKDRNKELCTLRNKYAKVMDECALKTKELVASKNNISILEEKFAKAESKALRAFEEKKTELDILNKQIKMQHCEIEGQVKEVNSLKKYSKDKEKEVFKLDGKTKNLESNIKRLKSEMSNLKKQK